MPLLCIEGGVGSWNERPAVSQRKRSSVASVESGGSSSRQPGNSSSSARGSMTAPEMMWAPTSLPFSTTQTPSSGCSCLRRMAAASPAGPAPTINTSNSIVSRSVIAFPSYGAALRAAGGMV